jgi:FemAB-related protein (PEP-CTERM system-associated)
VSEMKVIQYKNEMQARWDSFVMTQDQGSLFHTTAWLRVIQRAFGYKAYYLAAEHEGQITGVLPLFLAANPLTGKTLISTPFAVYGGVCAINEETRLLLMDAATALAKKVHVEYLELRTPQLRTDAGFQNKDLYVTFDCAIDPDPERLLKGLPKDTRYMIRKAQKAGLRVTKGNHQVNEFYEIYAQSVRNLGTPVFSKRFFKILLQEFGEAAEIMMVWKDQTAVAGVMSFRHRDWILPYYGGATLEARQYAANNFMYWELLEDARQRGIKFFDFGRSKLGTGAHAFKSQWNMRERPLPYQFHLVKRRDMPNFSPANPRFQRAIELWKHMPFPLTKLFGPMLVRLFP